MNDFRTPDYARKNKHGASHRSPPADKGAKVNEYAVRKAQVKKLVASLERAGHDTMLARLKMLMRTAILTTVQANEVQSEIDWRSAKVKELSRIIANAQRQIDLQLTKVGLPLEERTAVTVPGPSGPTMKALRKLGDPVDCPVTRERPQKSVTMREGDGSPGSNHVRHSLTGKSLHAATMKIDVKASAPATWFPGIEAPMNMDGDHDEQ